MSRRHEKILESWHSSQERHPVWASRPQTRPAALQVCLGQARNETVGQAQQIADGPGRGPLVEAGLLFGGPDQDSAVRPRHEIPRPPQKDAVEERRTRVDESNLSAHRMDAGLPADRLQQGFAPRSRRQEEFPRFCQTVLGPDGSNPLALDFKTQYGTTRLQANAEQLTPSQQRTQMPWIAHLGHVRQIIGSAQPGPESRFQLAKAVVVNRLERDSFAPPFLSGDTAFGIDELQPAAAQVAVIHSGSVP